MASNYEQRQNKEWIGYVQPTGVVVSAPALVAAQAFPTRDASRLQGVLDTLAPPGRNGSRAFTDFRRLTHELFGWEARDLLSSAELPDALSAALPEYGDLLRPTWAVPDPDRRDGWLMLIEELPLGAGLDEEVADGGARRWRATPQARFERLLRETRVPTGLLVNGTSIRLVYAPPGESSGHMTFVVDDMLKTDGRRIVAALHMLLSAERLFSVPVGQRLAALLRESRRYQNEVSTELADQVLEALYELTRGMQAADDLRVGALLGEAARSAPNEVYGGLLTTLLRLVFVLYAEDRGLLPGDSLYVQHYSVAGLFEQLREDAARHADTMDQRYGAWARLLTLFRMLHDGAQSGRFRVPPRHGRLFDPDAYPFLEGRPFRTRRVMGERVDPPQVSDGCVYRVLERLLMLDGDRLSYRALDVEQIGSVYEAIMGFELVVAYGTSVAVVPKSKKPGSASHPVINLDALLAMPGDERTRRLKEDADCELTGASLDALKRATSVDELLAALGRKVSRFTPRPVRPGAIMLNPTEERRRSGSHYTPRSLTEPIVRTTLEPVLEALGERPTPDQILDLNVCDPAMGSGAFLVETTRFLGAALEKAWQQHGVTPNVPPDEDVQLHARRLVAQRCVYGVDRNLFAVDLAKLSLWLVTLAKGHPFTFVDHALKCGDSLVGFSRKQIKAFDWADDGQLTFVGETIDARLREAEELRDRIEELAESDDVREKTRLLREADLAADDARLIGNTLVAAFFRGETPKERKNARQEIEEVVRGWLSAQRERGEVEEIAEELEEGERPLRPLHWDVEFPESFNRENPGFDAFVGNPPFAGKNSIIAGNREGYLPYLQAIHPESHGNSDLVAHFFRRAFALLRQGGTFGLIATNTVAQGDTRSTGLRWICNHHGTLYHARKRLKWPGHAAVVVSVVHGYKGQRRPPFVLDGRQVDRITAYLFHAGGHDDPAVLSENRRKSFQGSTVLGMGFTFDNENPEATPIVEMHRLVAQNPHNAERIFPYIGGEEVNESPTHSHRRYVINFGEMTEEAARAGWPDLLAVVEAKARGKRGAHSTAPWWQFERPRAELYQVIAPLSRVIVNSQISARHAFAFQPPTRVFSHALNVFAFDSYAAFALLQSRVHEVWARFLGSSMKDDLRYTPSDCFETFPLPSQWQGSKPLEVAGESYAGSRSALMIRNDQGLTKTYNRLHDPNERSTDILHLRELHAEMDRAVLNAYAWTDIPTDCEFLLDYEDEEGEEDVGTTRRKKKPWRYRWPDDVRDEVLARLLELNRRRAAGLSDRDAEPSLRGVTASPVGAR